MLPLAGTGEDPGKNKVSEAPPSRATSARRPGTQHPLGLRGPGSRYQGPKGLLEKKKKKSVAPPSRATSARRPGTQHPLGLRGPGSRYQGPKGLLEKKKKNPWRPLAGPPRLGGRGHSTLSASKVSMVPLAGTEGTPGKEKKKKKLRGAP